MKKNVTATSIIEAMVVLLVVVTGIIGVYKLLISSQRLTDSTAKRIEAIQIARDGLEAFTNIRDTNWLVFAGDPKNCWNVQLYNSKCIGNGSKTDDIGHFNNQGIRIYRNNNNAFVTSSILHPIGDDDYTSSTYRTNFAIRKDSRGFYDQSTGTVYGVNGQPFYTREIQLDYLDASNISQGSDASNQPKLKVTAIVQWKDPASDSPRKLEMSTILTNWKNTN